MSAAIQIAVSKPCQISNRAAGADKMILPFDLDLDLISLGMHILSRRDLASQHAAVIGHAGLCGQLRHSSR